ncbi:MAG: hypothetical protein ACLQU4_19925 [Limisphaerales bacterium]
MYTLKGKQPSRWCSGGARELQRRLSVASIFVFLAGAAGQDTGGNTTTNQPQTQTDSTNAASGQNAVTTSLTNTFQGPIGFTNGFQPQNPLIYQIGVTPNPPLMMGPGAVGADQPAMPLTGTAVLAAPHGAAGEGVPLGPGIPLWGPFDIHPSFTYSLTEGNGIESQPGRQENLIVQTVGAGLLFDLGSNWRLDYNPYYTIYANSAYRDTLAESVALSGGTTYEDWAFNLSQTYSKTDEPLIETGTQTSQEDYGTALGAVYQMGSKVSLRLGADQSLRYAYQFDNVESWTGSAGLNYQFIPQFGAGLSLSGGYNDISQGSSMPFETVQGTVNFVPGEKLALNLSGGAEDMQFVDPSAPPLITPIFSAMLRYQLFRNTSVSVGGSRSVSPSFFGNEVLVETEVGGWVRQQLTPKLSLAVNAGYTTEPLTGVVPAPQPRYFLGPAPTAYLTETEQQNTTTYGVSLSYAFVTHGAFTAFYSVNNNSSSQSNFKYSSTQAGFSINYTY